MQKKLWELYRINYSYASDIEFEEVIIILKKYIELIKQ